MEINAIENPSYMDGDIRARFSIKVDDKKSDYFDLDRLTEIEVRQSIEYNIDYYIRSITSLHALKELLKQNPLMLYQTNLATKNLLNI